MKFVLYNSIAGTCMGNLDSPSAGSDPLHLEIEEAQHFNNEMKRRCYLLFNFEFWQIVAVEVAEVMNV